LNHHYPWIKYLLEKHGSSNDNGQAEDIIRAEVGQKCQRVLSDAGVFKTDNKGRQAFNKFLASCGLRPEKSKQKVL
jgi:UDPglucose--hexose-1-phosphate uridylyltransferase